MGPGRTIPRSLPGAPLDDWWANQFDAVPGGQWITSIGVAFGHTSTFGTPVSFHLYEDVNDNGLPDDLQLLASVDTTITVINDEGATPQLQTVTLPVPKLVSGSFFVAALVLNAPFETRFLADTTPSRTLVDCNQLGEPRHIRSGRSRLGAVPPRR